MATDAGTVALPVPPAPVRTPLRRVLPWMGRHRVATGSLALVLALGPWEASFASALAGPGPGSLSARAAEWVRDHGGASAVTWIENLWYSHHPPPKGGRPPHGAIPPAAGSVEGSAAGSTAGPVAGAAAGTEGASRLRPAPVHLAPPAAVVPLASPPLPGEGLWHPAGRLVDGVPAMYEAFLRPDAVHTSLVAGAAWMDPNLLRFQLYSGSYIPGGGPWSHSAPVTPGAATSLVAAFNSGFRLKDAMGGYYSEGRTAAPLRAGAASLVIYRDGTATVADWGRDAIMTPQVAAVRQNLRLLVDGGIPVPGLATSRTWGATVRNRVFVWRSGLGVTASGALVYVAGPGLDVPSLASLLIRVGSVRAMELDINRDWVNLTTYSPPGGTGRAGPANAVDLLWGMAGGTERYFAPWWNRDFVAAFAAPRVGTEPAPADRGR